FLNSWPSCDPGQARRPWYRQERLRRSGESWFSFPDLLSLLISCELSVEERLPFEFEAALAATVVERGVFGARLHYFAETGSTNDLASAAAERGEREGTTFVAGSQTAGRGRRGREWFSPPGSGLYLSTIVRRASIGPWLTLAGGVAVAEGIRAASGLPVQIKWP